MKQSSILSALTKQALKTTNKETTELILPLD